jgi:DNA-binding response OmpR family regulator
MIERFSCARMRAPVRVLVATPNDRHYRALETAILGAGWSLFRSCNLVEGLSAVINHEIEVIFTDCELPDGSWREMVQSLRACRNAPRVIVFSQLADDRLWMDVLQSGGYDLVATPFNSEEIVLTGHRAWLSWQKKARGLRSVWFPVEEPEAELPEVGQMKHRRAAAGARW